MKVKNEKDSTVGSEGTVFIVVMLTYSRNLRKSCPKFA
jgi:hypothetical protein